MQELKTTGKYSVKSYQCNSCGKMEEIGTNHWGEIYPFCTKCGKQTAWTCLATMPNGYKAPEKWKFVKPEDIAEIIFEGGFIS